MTYDNDNESSIMASIIVFTICFFFIFGSVTYVANWSDYNTLKGEDYKCRQCANEYNLTCVEKEPLKNIYMNIHNINSTFLDCTHDYNKTWEVCKSCFSSGYYAT